MRTYKFLIICLVAVAFAFSSCEQKYEKQYSWAYPVAGDWMVKAYVVDSTKSVVDPTKYTYDTTAITGPWEMKSYNSSFGKDSIWVDDYGTSTMNADSTWKISAGNFWTMQVKCAVDMSTKTFQTKSSMNAIGGYPNIMKVLNGKVINNDSIFYEIQFEDDSPSFGTTYLIAGHREVSYEEYVQQ